VGAADNRPVAPADPGRAAGVRAEGPAVPGLRMTLRLDQPARPGSHYLWVQTKGPAVDLGERTGPELRLSVPSGADALGFLLIVADDRGIRTTQVDVPIASPAGPDAGRAVTTGGATAPVADAGDDLIGMVGSRITLDGSASRPRAGLAYRWIQLGGPEVESPVEAGSVFSFVPRVEGVYRFALVVAGHEAISAPDQVTVTVARPGLATPAGDGPPGAAPIPSGDELEAVVDAARASLAEAPGLATPLADAFEAVAFRMDLYPTYADAHSEFSRRLDAILPPDPARRARWSDALFGPLSRIIILRLWPLGIDLGSPAGWTAPLTDPQKGELKAQFERTARLLRSVGSNP